MATENRPTLLDEDAREYIFGDLLHLEHQTKISDPWMIVEARKTTGLIRRYREVIRFRQEYPLPVTGGLIEIINGRCRGMGLTNITLRPGSY